jgi:hypothetical protein
MDGCCCTYSGYRRVMHGLQPEQGMDRATYTTASGTACTLAKGWMMRRGKRLCVPGDGVEVGDERPRLAHFFPPPLDRSTGRLRSTPNRTPQHSSVRAPRLLSPRITRRRPAASARRRGSVSWADGTTAKIQFSRGTAILDRQVATASGA